MRDPTIAYDASAAVLTATGVGRYAAQLADRLAGGRNAKRFRLLSAGWQGRRGDSAPSGWLVPADVRSIAGSHRDLRARLAWSILTGWRDDSRWGRPALIHSPEPQAPSTSGALSIVTVHDLTYRLLPACHTLPNRLFSEFVVGRSVRRADAVLAVSATTRDDLVEHLGVPRERIRVVYPGVAPAFALRDETACRAAVAQRLGLDRGFVLTVGAREPRKNHLFLVRVFSELVHRHGYEGRLVLVGGGGWGRAPVEEEAARHRVAERLLLAGRLPDEAVAELYATCDAFVFPSLYEGFGSPVAEALACGAPVAVSDRGALPEVVGDAGAVLALDDPARWAETILLLLTPEARARARREGPRRAALFSYDAAARAVEQLYDSLLG